MRAERLLAALAAIALFPAARAASTWDEAAAELRAASLTPEQALVIVEQARAHRLSPNNIHPWAERIGRLAQNGIPPAIAGERLVQGLSKGVAVERLDRAFADLDDNLKWLSGLLERTTARADRRDHPGGNELALRAGEAALRAGFQRAQLERVLGPGPLTLEQAVALSHAAGSLLAANIEPAEVAGALDGAGGAGVGANQIRQLERRFVAALSAGRPPRSAFEEFKTGLKALIAQTGAAAGSAVQRDPMQQEMREQLQQEMREQLQQEMREQLRQEMRETIRGSGGGSDMRPSVSPGAGHAAKGRR
jgi:hypothetical protein